MAIYDDIFGTLLDSRYRVRQELGAGGFGRVFAADHEIFGTTFRPLALKLFTRGHVRRENAQEVFREALLLEGLAAAARSRGERTHLVTVYDLGVLADLQHTPFVAMELVDGGSLEGVLRRSGPLPVATVLRYARQICAGLRLAHEASPPVVHRDLKAANVLVSHAPGEPYAKVADFGLAVDRYRAFLEAGGTENFTAAPEARLHAPPSPAYDVYSLGMLLVELLTGSHPIPQAVARARAAGRSRAEALHQAWEHLARLEDPGRGVPLTEAVPELRRHRRLRRVLRRCLALEPAARYRDARAVCEALGGATGQAEIETAEPLTASTAAAAPPPAEQRREARLLRALGEARRARSPRQLERAARQLEALRATHPDSSGLLDALSRLYERQGRLAAAIELQKTLLRSQRSPPGYRRLAALHERDGDGEQARAALLLAGDLGTARRGR